jgi:hypothetical protein
MKPKYKLFYYWFLCGRNYVDSQTFSLRWALEKWYAQDEMVEGSLINYALDLLIMKENK